MDSQRDVHRVPSWVIKWVYTRPHARQCIANSCMCNVCMCIYIYIYMYDIHISLSLYIYIYIHIYIYILCIQLHILTHTHIHTYTHTYTYTYTYSYIYIYICEGLCRPNSFSSIISKKTKQYSGKIVFIRLSEIGEKRGMAFRKIGHSVGSVSGYVNHKRFAVECCNDNAWLS